MGCRSLGISEDATPDDQTNRDRVRTAGGGVIFPERTSLQRTIRNQVVATPRGYAILAPKNKPAPMDKYRVFSKAEERKRKTLDSRFTLAQLSFKTSVSSSPFAPVEKEYDFVLTSYETIPINVDGVIGILKFSETKIQADLESSVLYLLDIGLSFNTFDEDGDSSLPPYSFNIQTNIGSVAGEFPGDTLDFTDVSAGDIIVRVEHTGILIYNGRPKNVQIKLEILND